MPVEGGYKREAHCNPRGVSIPIHLSLSNIVYDQS